MHRATPRSAYTIIDNRLFYTAKRCGLGSDESGSFAYGSSAEQNQTRSPAPGTAKEPDIYRMEIEAPDIAAAARPGQFVNLYTGGGLMILPRPIGIADAREKNITLYYAVIGAGTRLFAELQAGETIDVMGPLGNGFFDYPGSIIEPKETRANQAATPSTPPLSRPQKETILLIGGGAGIPPLLYAARRIRHAMRGSVIIDAFLGYRSKPWVPEGLAECCDKVYIASETEGCAEFTGNAMELLAKYAKTDAHYAPALACGPAAMLKAAAAWCESAGIPLRVSLEARMGCGYGACAACTCEIRQEQEQQTVITRKKICSHGPVFWGNEVVWL